MFSSMKEYPFDNIHRVRFGKWFTTSPYERQHYSCKGCEEQPVYLREWAHSSNSDSRINMPTFTFDYLCEKCNHILETKEDSRTNSETSSN